MARSDGGETEYAVLAAALDEHPAPCRDIPIFTADEISNEALADAARICRDCPLRAVCEGYAMASNPRAGIWAGRTYPRRRNLK